MFILQKARNAPKTSLACEPRALVEFTIVKRHRVRVSPLVIGRIAGVKDELAGRGVGVRLEANGTGPTAGRAARYEARNVPATFVWDVVGHAWLVFSISKAAIGGWPKIRRILVNGGLRDDEIMTLGLSQLTRTSSKKMTRTKTKARAGQSATRRRRPS
jgi:hypothetical protein